MLIRHVHKMYMNINPIMQMQDWDILYITKISAFFHVIYGFVIASTNKVFGVLIVLFSFLCTVLHLFFYSFSNKLLDICDPS